MPHFTGRTVEFEELRKALAGEAPAVCVVAVGLGGVGKTALVRQFVATEAQTLFPDGVAWLDAGTMPSELARVAVRFGWTGTRMPTPREACVLLTRELRDRSFLVVVDNVLDEADTTNLPVPGGRSRTIFTTRSRTLDDDLDRDAYVLRLDCWDPSSARAFLYKMVPGLTLASSAELDSLTAFVGRLPLALRLVARLLKRASVTPGGLLAELEREPLKMLDSVAKGADRGVAATFLASYRTLDEGPRSALLALAACARATTAAVVATVLGVSEAVAAKSLADLVGISLAEHAAGAERPWGMHDVVRLFAQKQDGYERAVEAHRAFASAHLTAHPDPQDWRAAGREIPEVLAGVDNALDAGDPESADVLLTTARSHLLQRGRYSEVVDRSERLLRLLPPPRQAAVLNLIGTCKLRVGAVSEALESVKRALSLDEQFGQVEGQARDHGNLGACYRLLGQVPEAMRHFHQSMTFDQQLGRHEGQARTLCNLGSLSLTRGEPQQAIQHYDQSLGVAVLGPQRAAPFEERVGVLRLRGGRRPEEPDGDAHRGETRYEAREARVVHRALGTASVS